MHTVHIIIRGKVQGVFFRKYAFETAIKLGIDGFVKNDGGGNVVIEAAGEKDNVDKFVQWCHEGSPRSEVEQVEVSEIPERDYQGFTIRY